MNIEDQILEGLLLSDMSINKRSNPNHNSFITLTTIHLPFATHLKQVLPSHDFKLYTRKARVSFDLKLQKTFNHKESYYFTSNVKHQYTLLRSKWYPEGKKVIPKDIILSPISLKYLFYGDGNCSKYSNDSWQVGLATNSFTKEDCIFLKELLLTKYNLNFTLSKASPRKEQYTLRLQRKEEVKDFFRIIGQPIDCFSYKWKLGIISKKKPNKPTKKIIYKPSGEIFNSLKEAADMFELNYSSFKIWLRARKLPDFNYL